MGSEHVEEKFWMVYGEGQRAPTFKHQSRTSATQEATRLARAYPGLRFVVLEAVEGREIKAPVPPPVVTIGYVDLPF